MRQHTYLLFTSLVIILSTLTGCSPSTEELAAVDYTPLVRDDWEVSTPLEQGLDPMLVAEMYYKASELESIYCVLVIKKSKLIAEGYFNEGSVEQLSARHSVTPGMAISGGPPGRVTIASTLPGDMADS